jgi:hypothetical protein
MDTTALAKATYRIIEVMRQPSLLDGRTVFRAETLTGEPVDLWILNETLTEQLQEAVGEKDPVEIIVAATEVLPPRDWSLEPAGSDDRDLTLTCEVFWHMIDGRYDLTRPGDGNSWSLNAGPTLWGGNDWLGPFLPSDEQMEEILGPDWEDKWTEGACGEGGWRYLWEYGSLVHFIDEPDVADPIFVLSLTGRIFAWGNLKYALEECNTGERDLPPGDQFDNGVQAIAYHYLVEYYPYAPDAAEWENYCDEVMPSDPFGQLSIDRLEDLIEVVSPYWDGTPGL